MKRIILIPLFLALFALPGFSQGDKDQPRKDAPSESVQNIKLAYILAQYGYLNESPLALAQAAEILILLPPDAKWSIELAESDESTVPLKKGTIAIDFTPEALLSDAISMAKGNTELIKVIEAISPSTSRGRVGGPGKIVEQVKAKSNDIYYIKFWGGQLAEILVSGDGDTDLDLYVFDENGNLIAKDDDNTDDCYVRFIPKWTGSFKVVVKNLGNVYNRYLLLTN